MVKLTAKYHISIVHKTKGILAVTMEFSTKHLVCFTPAVQVGWIQLKPDQSSLVQFSVHDSISNSMALLHHFCFGLQQERLCKTDLTGLKFSVNIANPHSKLLCTEVRQVYQTFRKQTLYV